MFEMQRTSIIILIATLAYEQEIAIQEDQLSFKNSSIVVENANLFDRHMNEDDHHIQAKNQEKEIKRCLVNCQINLYKNQKIQKERISKNVWASIHRIIFFNFILSLKFRISNFYQRILSWNLPAKRQKIYSPQPQGKAQIQSSKPFKLNLADKITEDILSKQSKVIQKQIFLKASYQYLLSYLLDNVKLAIKIVFLTLFYHKKDGLFLIKVGVLFCLVTNCFSCVTGCNPSACNISANNCTACIGGYYFTPSTHGTCTHCNVMPRCLLCLNQTSCIDCQFSYYPNSSDNSSCLQCSYILNNCTDCINSTYCISCSSTSFYLYDYGNSTALCNLCSTAILNCSKCSSDIICTDCTSTQYYLDSMTQTGSIICTVCSVGILNCFNCTNGTYCLYCNSTKYYLNNYGVGKENCTICSTSLFGCVDCTNSTYCLSCMASYFLYSNGYLTRICSSCKAIMPGCSDCLNQTYCTVCDLTFYLKIIGVNAQSCGSCWNALPNFTNCLYCQNVTSAANISVLSCTFCAVNYVAIPNNQSIGICELCVNVLEGCQLCMSPTSCYSCVPSAYVFIDKTHTCKECSKAIPNCANCAQSICTACLSGFYLKTHTSCGLCSDILVGCMICQNASICNSCTNTYYLKNYTCIPCSSTFPKCSTCTTTHCLSCQSSFYLNSFLKCACVKGKLVGNWCINVYGCNESEIYRSRIVCTDCSDDFGYNFLTLSCQCKNGQYITGSCTTLIGCISVFTYPQNYSQKCIMCNLTGHFQLQNQSCFCRDGFILINQIWACNQICGDGRIFVLPCDDGNTRDGDGCSSSCQIQSHFNCLGGNVNNSSNCLYLGKQIDLQLSNIYKLPQSNTGVFVFKVINIAPFTDYINFLTFSHFNALPKHTASSALYSQGKLKVIVDYTQDLEGRPANFTLDFKQFLFTNAKPLSIPFSMISSTSPLVILNYPSEESLALLSHLLMGASALTFILFIVGSQFHKMIGLQTLHAFQFAYFLPLAITDSSIVLNCFKQVSYSTGFGKQLFYNLEQSQVFGSPFIQFEANKQFFAYIAVDGAYLLIAVILLTLISCYVVTSGKKKQKCGLIIGRQILFQIYHRVVFPVAIGFASILLVAILLNNLEIHQWQSEFKTVIATSNYNIIPSKANSAIILLVSTPILIIVALQIIISLSSDHDVSQYQMDEQKGPIKILILNQDNIGAYHSYVGLYLMSNLFILSIAIVSAFTQSFLFIFLLTFFILIYTLIIAFYRPYNRKTDNFHIFLIQITELLIGLGLSAKQFFIQTHHELEPNSELIYAWIVTIMLIAIDLLAAVRIYMTIKGKTQKITDQPEQKIPQRIQKKKTVNRQKIQYKQANSSLPKNTIFSILQTPSKQKPVDYAQQSNYGSTSNKNKKYLEQFIKNSLKDKVNMQRFLD